MLKRCFWGFSKEERELVEEIFTSLVSSREGSIEYRRSRLLSEFDESSRIVIERLIEARLVSVSQKEGYRRTN